MIKIAVQSINDAPVVIDNVLSTLEDTPLTIGSADFGFTDPLDFELGSNQFSRVQITTLPTQGYLTLADVLVTTEQFVPVADLIAGNLVYHPVLNGNGAPYGTFTFQVEDDGGILDGGDNLDPTANTMTINITEDNDASIASDNGYSTNEDAPLIVNAATGVLADDTDVDSVALNAVLVTTPTPAGLVFNTDGSFVYTPADDFNGEFSFEYMANDGKLDSNTAAVTITVAAVNDAPVLSAIPAQVTNEMTLLTFNALGTDVDLNPTLTYSLAGTPPSGTVPEGASIVDGTGVFSWTPTEVQGPSDSDYGFDVCVSDGFLSHCQTVTVDVNEVNLPPVGVDDTLTILEDTPTYTDIFVLANDTDPDFPANSLGWLPPTVPTKGTLTLGANIAYKPNVNLNGADSFTYKVTDGSLTVNATVNITITPVNDLPVLENIPNQTISEGGEFSPISLDGYVSDVETVDTGIVWTTSGATDLIVTIVDRVATITIPDLNWNGTETITFTATDTDQGAASYTAIFTVTPI